MDVSGLTYDSDKTEKAITILEDNSVIANRRLDIYIPQRFVENGLAQVTDFVYTAPILGFVIPGECFSCFTSMLKMKMFPSEMVDEVINGDRYVNMQFYKGDVVFESLLAPKDPNISYFYFMEFLNYAKIPWYMNDEDHSSLFDSAADELGKAVGSSPQVIRLMCSMIYRDPDDLDKPYRYSKAKKEGRPPVIVGMNNPSMLIDDSFSKLMGGYLADNLLSAMLKPSDKITTQDRMMRGMPTDVSPDA